jgi:hypothetical protein
MTNQTASTPSGIYLSPVSTTLTHTHTLSPCDYIDFIDHYAVMGLDNWATSEEIKTAFRRLRGTYFNTDAVKYRALQAAFDVLANREARWSYDRVWREWRGLPGPPPLVAHNVGIVKERVGILERKDSKEVLCSAPVCEETEVEEEEEEEVMVGEEDLMVVHAPVTGTREYHSHIPILSVYEGQSMHPTLKCGRPKYVLEIAEKAMP